MKRLLLLCLLAACRKQEPPPKETPAPQLSATEIQRSSDACKAYVEKVCACAASVAAQKSECQLAPALPEAVRIGIEVSQSPDSKKADVLAAEDSVRKTVKTCIEHMAKLPALGCP